jgi:hypothetical protein
MENPLFTRAEVEEMEKRTVDRVIEAIEAGDKEKQKDLPQRMYNEFLSMHDLYRNWTTATLSEIGKRFGDEVLEQIMIEGVKAWWLPNIEKLPQGPEALPQRIKMFVAGLHGHLQPMHIEEDEEKVVIQMRPCGSGGRLVLEGSMKGRMGFIPSRNPSDRRTIVPTSQSIARTSRQWR